MKQQPLPFGFARPALATMSARAGLRVCMLTLVCQAGAAQAQSSVDLHTGNAASQVVIPAASRVLPGVWGPGDASLIFRALALLGNGWFDAIAPYHPTAVGVHSSLGRRPSSERADNYQRNVAILYASYRVLNNLLPTYASNWNSMLTGVGLDPQNVSTDIATPEGIGNSAGSAVVAARMNDGMNQLGNAGDCRYNCRPYSDYTGYQPVNSAYVLTEPGRWQPSLSSGAGNGIFTVQHFVTPQYALTRPYSYTDPAAFTVPAPGNSDPANAGAYQLQADEVLAASAALNDERKLKAELFDNKYQGFGGAIGFAAGQNRLFQDLDRYVQYYFLANLAAFDTGIAVWQEKFRHDAVRPFSAIRHLYGDSPVTAWGGPGVGTVSDLPASQWRAYLNVANHPEYPSGSASFCSAIAQVSRRYFGSDALNLTRTYRRGSSVVEPGRTPASDLTLSFSTWTAWAEDCGQSRVDGGVHFQAAVDVAPLLALPIADLAYDFVTRHIAGNR